MAARYKKPSGVPLVGQVANAYSLLIFFGGGIAQASWYLQWELGNGKLQWYHFLGTFVNMSHFSKSYFCHLWVASFQHTLLLFLKDSSIPQFIVNIPMNKQETTTCNTTFLKRIPTLQTPWIGNPSTFLRGLPQAEAAGWRAYDHRAPRATSQIRANQEAQAARKKSKI